MDSGIESGALSALRARLRALEENPIASEEREFLARAEALDELELGVSLPIEGLASRPDAPEDLDDLRRRAEALLTRWEALDDALFRSLRGALRHASDPGATFRGLWETFLPRRAFDGPREIPGYDARDAFLAGLLHADPVPVPIHALEPGMVQLQNTPARILMELMEKSGLGPSDTFFDIGSGLGQIPLWVHLLSGARVWGIEREPAYVDYASACAAALGLSQVGYRLGDARAADYSDATVLFLYTPFRGPMLQAVLDRMRSQCRSGARMFTYGPVNAEIAGQDWLRPLWPVPDEGLGGFAFP
jgi:hypothetical protein